MPKNSAKSKTHKGRSSTTKKRSRAKKLKTTRARVWLGLVTDFLSSYKGISFKKQRRIRIPVAGIVAGLGIVLLSLSLWYHQYQRTVLTFDGLEQPSVVELPEFTGVPLQLEIEDQAIDLPIEPGVIENGIWQISDHGVSHLSSSAVPGQGSNIVLYGHNKWHLLYKLRNVTEGDMIAIKADNGRTYEYQVQKVVVVSPEEIEWVLPTQREQLTVYTCTGFFDSQRFVVTALPVRVSS